MSRIADLGNPFHRHPKWRPPDETVEAKAARIRAEETSNIIDMKIAEDTRQQRNSNRNVLNMLLLGQSGSGASIGGSLIRHGAAADLALVRTGKTTVLKSKWQSLHFTYRQPMRL